jgi:hypothetical protein
VTVAVPARWLSLGYAARVMPTIPGAVSERADGTPPLPANDPELFALDLRGLRRRWADRAAMTPIGGEAMTGADRRARHLGVAEERLMEHAGTAVAAAVHALATDTERWGTGPIVILCGPGNNGGDGFVAARRLALAGARVVVAVIAAEARPRNATSARNWDRIARDAGIVKVHAPVGRRADRARSCERHPGRRHRYPDGGRPVERRALGPGGPGRPDRDLPPTEDGPADQAWQGPCRQGPRRAHRHPRRG